MLNQVLKWLRRSVDLAALAATLSWALLVDALDWNVLVDKPPHCDKVSSFEGAFTLKVCLKYVEKYVLKIKHEQMTISVNCVQWNTSRLNSYTCKKFSWYNRKHDQRGHHSISSHKRKVILNLCYISHSHAKQ